MKTKFINQGASVVAHHSIEIGGYTLIGGFAAIYDNHHGIDPDHPAKLATVVIGINVWLGRGTLVLAADQSGTMR